MLVSTLSRRVCIQDFFLPVLIVGIGLLALIGYQTDIPFVYELGLSSAAAPLPLPFTDHTLQQENFSYRYILYITRGSGTKEVAGRSSMIHGSHKQKIALMSSVIFSPLHNPLVKNALHYNFCLKDHSSDLFSETDEISSVIIDIQSPVEKNNQIVFISCHD